MDYYSSVGQIIYNPPRPGVTYRGSEGWCILTVDKEITRYYRWWLKFQNHIHLHPPSWDAHISIVRGEKLKPTFEPIWKKHTLRKVEFLIPHGDIRVGRSQRTDARADRAVKGDYYYIDVICPELFEIRKELGLHVNFKSFHVTIGRTREYVSGYENRLAVKKQKHEDKQIRNLNELIII